MVRFVDSETLRFDKWLWCVRLYKSRALARQAIVAGHVRVNGSRIKPARIAATGDVVAITREPAPRTFVVTGLPRRRGPASEAATMYKESEESVERVRLAVEERRLQRASSPHPERRPDKRSRRRIIRFTKG